VADNCHGRQLGGESVTIVRPVERTDIKALDKSLVGIWDSLEELVAIFSDIRQLLKNEVNKPEP
jgi:hypothetical protein